MQYSLYSAVEMVEQAVGVFSLGLEEREKEERRGGNLITIKPKKEGGTVQKVNGGHGMPVAQDWLRKKGRWEAVEPRLAWPNA